jgi:hypothetical protein
MITQQKMQDFEAVYFQIRENQISRDLINPKGISESDRKTAG